MKQSNKFCFLSLPIADYSTNDIAEIIKDRIGKKKFFSIVIIDEYLALKSIFSKKLKLAILSSDIILTNSRLIRWLAGKKGIDVNIIDYHTLVISAIDIAAELGETIFIYGASKYLLDIAISNLKTTFDKPPVFVGSHQSNIHKSREDIVAEGIRKATPSLLIVSTGDISRDIKYIYKHKQSNFANVLCVTGKDVVEYFATGKNKKNKLKRVLYIPFDIMLFFYSIFRLIIKSRSC